MISDGNESKRRKLIGETLQTWSRDEILRVFPELEPEDVVSVPMGATGEDLLLSDKALKLLNNVSVEMKNQKKGNKTLYQFMTQAKKQAKGMASQTRNTHTHAHTNSKGQPIIPQANQSAKQQTKQATCQPTNHTSNGP